MQFVKYELDDGETTVYFESSDSDLVSRRGDPPEVADGGRLSERLSSIAAAAGEVSDGMRRRLDCDEVELTFGVKISGSVGWWVFGKADGEALIQVRTTWKRSGSAPGDATPGPGRTTPVTDPHQSPPSTAVSPKPGPSPTSPVTGRQTGRAATGETT